ncbi:LysM peptidoglycan-binding domain-containing protein [Neobacillus sp. OS1-32]|jgi:LysM repeat protein|uniref:LysM peptidoglycan-binding domain-containing protein n=1 Tax=Neobacillus paridis TaxID=2803862 RepID=A0ABS1TN92_9BACI|nr:MULTISPECIES: LysM peptidoglycan-binding domain-containing protein [Neobacillus]MBL4952747.1 LysM peptidoglycan-binding domain-containing protein [Neobacillus paridis]WML31728.1 LysM peptidoglycan-binding domain-containing protein [Neobacillus sp. OS1-32]
MKKLWNQFSYAIILILLSFSFAIILSFQHGSEDQNDYLQVTVSEGDSLWKIAGQYSGQHSLSKAEFVNWVKRHNEKVDDQIYPGEKIVIPVSNKAPAATELASVSKQ